MTMICEAVGFSCTEKLICVVACLLNKNIMYLSLNNSNQATTQYDVIRNRNFFMISNFFFDLYIIVVVCVVDCLSLEGLYICFNKVL